MVYHVHYYIRYLEIIYNLYTVSNIISLGNKKLKKNYDTDIAYLCSIRSLEMLSRDDNYSFLRVRFNNILCIGLTS